MSKPTVTIDQLYFTAVDAEASPRKITDYQVYRTSDMSLVELEGELGSRLVLGSNEGCDLKRTFFRLSNGLFAIAKVVPYPEGVDRYGRRGIDFAHALVLDEDEFRALDGNPFVLLDRPELWHGPNEVICRDPVPSVELPKLRIDSLPRVSPTLSDRARRLMTYALRSSFMRLERRVLAVQASESTVADLLREIFDSMPFCVNANCTFDTDDGADLPLSGMWLVGSSRRRGEFANLVRGQFLDPEGGEIAWTDPGWLPEDDKEIRILKLLSSSLASHAGLREHIESILLGFPEFAVTTARPLFESIRTELPEEAIDSMVDSLGPTFLPSYLQPPRSDLQRLCRVALQPHYGQSLETEVMALIGELVTATVFRAYVGIHAVDASRVEEICRKYGWNWLLAHLYYKKNDWQRCRQILDDAEYRRFLRLLAINFGKLFRAEIFLTARSIRIGTSVTLDTVTESEFLSILRLIGQGDDSIHPAGFWQTVVPQFGDRMAFGAFIGGLAAAKSPQKTFDSRSYDTEHDAFRNQCRTCVSTSEVSASIRGGGFGVDLTIPRSERVDGLVGHWAFKSDRWQNIGMSKLEVFVQNWIVFGNFLEVFCERVGVPAS